MTSQRPQSRWTGKYPPGGPADWIADGHLTCNIQCSGGNFDRRMVDVRLDTLPQHQPWSRIGRRLVCSKCGAAGSVNIVPNWHDRIGRSCHSPSIGKRETQLLKLTTDRPFANPEKAARRLLEHAHAFEPIHEGRIYIEKINGPFLFGDKGTPAEYSAGLELAVARGWLELHESGTYVKFTTAGADLFA